MKDKKMAEEIANKKLCATIMCYNHCDFNSPEPHKCGDWHRCYECALAGLKAGRPQWHDLEKDPNDLPKDSKEVLIITSDNRKHIGFYAKDWYCSECGGIVIAWCEIPTFDREIEGND